MNKLILLVIIIVQTATNIQAQFVHLENSGFKLNGQNYYPMVLNYGVLIRKNSQNEYWVTPSHCYGNTNEFECHNKADCLDELKAHFQMVKDMGFNAIRLCGISPRYNLDYFTNKTGKIYMTSWLLDSCTSSVYSQCIQEEITPSVRTKMFSYINDVLDVAADRDIKVLLLCGGPDTAIYREKYADYLEALAINFRNNTTLLGYDLFNEPTYFSKMRNEGLNKSQICSIVSSWISRMKAADPNHLITIGFTNSNTVYDWDPELIAVDFASFHPYGTFNQVGNEIFWYADNITKPWIIGETGLPSDDTLTTYEEQKQFASIVSKRCIDCGGYGFSWWQYQDVWWGDYDQNYFGLLNHNGITNTTVSGLSVQGTPKPAVDVFKNFSAYIPNYNCPIYTNYYNVPAHHKTKVSGKIINDSNYEAIGGAVVIGRDSTWDIISTTFTHPDGSFELYTDSDNPIRIINYDYLETDNGVSFLPRIDNSNPTNINNVTINIGQSLTYNSQNSISFDSVVVKGDGANGGSVTINAPLCIKFNSRTKIEKGGNLKASLNRILTLPLRLKPLNSCSSSLNSVRTTEKSVTSSVSIEKDQGFSIYPNPANSFINIESNNTQYKSIDLYDVFGRLLISKTTKNASITFEISTLSTGIYLLKISTNEGFKLYRIIRQ